MPAFGYIFQGDPNAPIEASFPQTPGSPDNPLLLCWTTRRILYINTGESPLWSVLATLSPDSVIQQLSQPLLDTVIAQLRSDSGIPSPLCEPFARLLGRGY